MKRHAASLALLSLGSIGFAAAAESAAPYRDPRVAVEERITSLLAAMTLLPALLGVLGPRIDALAIGKLARMQLQGETGSGFWSRLAHFVMARPVTGGSASAE